jgi:vacuolar-type H+-ATPase subunit H
MMGEDMADEIGRNIMDAISDLEALVSDAKQPSIFGQGKRIVDEQEFYALIDDMRQLITREIQVAREKTAEAEQALVVANIQADRIISEAQTRAVEIGSEHEVARLAREHADDTRRVALSEANTIRAQADAYATKTRSKANQDATTIVNNAMRHANETIRKANGEAVSTIRNARSEAATAVDTARRQASDLMVSVDEVIANAQKALLSSRQEAHSLMESKVGALELPIAAISAAPSQELPKEVLEAAFAE